jgi:hypothetical protein
VRFSTRALRMGAQVAVIAGAIVATGCSGGNTTTPITTPIATPSPSATPGVLSLSSTSLTFIAVGAANAQPVTAMQANYAGSFTASTTTCGGIATISPATGTAFSVTPVAAGSCTFAIAGGAGQSTTLTIGVTTTNFGGS